MPNDLPTDYVSRAELAKRERRADEEEYEPMLKVRSLSPIEFTEDFNQFAARVAHALVGIAPKQLMRRII